MPSPLAFMRAKALEVLTLYHGCLGALGHVIAFLPVEN